MSPDPDRLADLMSRHFEGLLDETEESDLAAHLASSTEARASLATLMRIEGGIARLGEAGMLSEDRESRLHSLPVQRRRSPLKRTMAFAPVILFAATAVAAGIVLLVATPHTRLDQTDTHLEASAEPPPEREPLATPEPHNELATPTDGRAPTDAHTPAMPPPHPSTADVQQLEAPPSPVAAHDANQPPAIAPPTRATESRTAGYLDSVTGDVEVARGSEGTWSPVLAGAPVASGDRLRTTFSRACVAFESGSVMFLNRFTTLGVDLAEASLLPCVSLVGGEVYVETAANDVGFAVETPHGTAVDHGTRFVVNVKLNRTAVAVAEGSVSAWTDVGSVSLGENQEVLLVRRHSPPGTVRRIRDMSKRLAWARDDAGAETARAQKAPLNLALGRPCTASSVHKAMFDKRYGNDGDTKTLWASDATTRPQWWQVDLEAPCVITGVELVARQDDPPEDQPATRQGFQMRASNSQSFVWSVALATYTGAPFEAKGTWTSPVRDGGFYRYVRVVYNGSHFHFAELRVFGRALRKR